MIAQNVFDNLDDLHGMAQAGMEEGAADSHDRLAEILAEMQRAR